MELTPEDRRRRGVAGKQKAREAGGGFLRSTAAYRRALGAWQGVGDRPAVQNRRFLRGIRVLENPFLERYLTSAHWSLPGLWVLPLVAALLYRAAVLDQQSAGSIAAWGLLGLFAWTFAEYWLHRWLFHLPPAGHRSLRAIQFALHGYHHEFPEDPRRLVAPPVLAVPIATSLAALTVLLFPTRWPAVLAGLFSGYLAYDWIHYYAHHGRPRSRIGRYLRRCHQRHHYREAQRHFGLSSPLWDWVFGTS